MKNCKATKKKTAINKYLNKINLQLSSQFFFPDDNTVRASKRDDDINRGDIAENPRCKRDLHSLEKQSRVPQSCYPDGHGRTRSWQAAQGGLLDNHAHSRYVGIRAPLNSVHRPRHPTLTWHADGPTARYRNATLNPSRIPGLSRGPAAPGPGHTAYYSSLGSGSPVSLVVPTLLTSLQYESQ